MLRQLLIHELYLIALYIEVSLSFTDPSPRVIEPSQSEGLPQEEVVLRSHFDGTETMQFGLDLAPCTEVGDDVFVTTGSKGVLRPVINDVLAEMELLALD